MKTHSLFSELLAPEIEPTSAYAPDNKVALWSVATEHPIVFEVHEKLNNVFGFRYQAWVSWRDSEGLVRNHTWLENEPEGLMTDNLKEAVEYAKNYANSKNVLLSNEWLANPSFKRDA